nr:glycosyltransferase [Jejuia spongiicola]
MEGSTSFLQKNRTICKEELGVSLTQPVFIWVGRLNANKDPMCVLEALKQFKSFENNFEFYMFYHTTELLDMVKAFIVTNDLQENVFLKGNIKHEALEQWYNAADYYISASHKEGSGYALCEAMACGCVPIVSNIPSFYYMTNEGYAGLLFEKGNINDLCDKLQETINLNKEELRNRVTNVFKNRLSFEAIADGIYSIIQNVLSKNKL